MLALAFSQSKDQVFQTTPPSRGVALVLFKELAQDLRS
jgi:hypothetical protein